MTTIPEPSRTWRTSSFTSTGDCVEVAGTLDVIRDSKNPGEELPISPAAWASLLRSLS